ncbi:MAG: hypothetical protein VKL00_06580 [Synechococcales bacterium]|nr:hypothetical protein [Cyanobacteria bacterium REEB444]MEB3125284.1 hypothetical protein [Synechococcales bacterium]
MKKTLLGLTLVLGLGLTGLSSSVLAKSPKPTETPKDHSTSVTPKPKPTTNPTIKPSPKK